MKTLLDYFLVSIKLLNLTQFQLKELFSVEFYGIKVDFT